MLDLKSEFSATDIFSLSVYKEGTVYLLKGNGVDLVVKRERILQVHEKHFDLSKRAMGVVDKDVKNSRKLSEHELIALINYVRRQRALVQSRMRDRLPGAASDLDKALQTLQEQKTVWYKMPHLQMTDMQAALESQLGRTEARWGAQVEQEIDQSSDLMRTFLRTLRGSGGLESLGKIIAIDCFSGNEDRFSPEGGRPIDLGTFSHRFRALVNIGNLIITGSGKARTISGMDFADPSSYFREAEAAFVDQTKNRQWFGDHITNAALRKAFARDIIADLEVLLKMAPKKGIRERLPGGPLGLGAQRRLENGMISGARSLTAMIHEKRGRNKVFPTSFNDRADKFINAFG